MNADGVDRRPYWARFVDAKGRWVGYAGRPPGPPPGEELAALRRGAGREPGTVPQMWRFHVADVPEKYLRVFPNQWVPAAYAAEHHVLVLYGHHQQSKAEPMHLPSRDDEDDEAAGTEEGVSQRLGLGDAVRALHTTGRYSQDAVDRRFYAAVTADSLDELAVHLRGLVNQLRTLPTPRALDYTELQRQLVAWQFPEGRNGVRRSWGLQYHAFRPDDPKQDDQNAAPAA